MRKVYLIMDARAIHEIGDYICLSCCATLAEAIEEAPDYGEGCCIWRCDVKPNNVNDGDLINEKFIKQVYSKKEQGK